MTSGMNACRPIPKLIRMVSINTVFFSPHSDVQENFGLVNDGRVYALYTYTAEKDDELSFECGEELLVLTRGDDTEKEWWWARNNREETGYIPRNLLGVGDNTLCELVSMKLQWCLCFVFSCLIAHAAPKSSPNWCHIQALGEATLGNSNTFSWQQFERNQEQPALLGVSAVVYPATRRVFLPLSFPFSGARDGVAAQESVVGNTFRPLLCHRTIPPSPKDMNSWSRANHGLDMCLTGHTFLQRLGQDVSLDLKSWTRREH